MLVAALFRNSSFFQNNDVISHAHSGKTMGNNNRNLIGKAILNKSYLYWKNKYPFPINISFHMHRKNMHNKGLADLWFISGTSFMDKLSEIYDNLDDCKNRINDTIKREIDLKLNQIEVLKTKKKMLNAFSFN